MLDPKRLEVLDRAECMALLRSVPVGRIVFTDHALPAVQPVGFVVYDDAIVFRTAVDSRLAAASRNAVVAFEVDEIDAERATGWSVVVVGHANEVVDEIDLRMLRDTEMSWSPATGCFIRVTTEKVTGRRLVPGLAGDDE
ncbi:pyridoxamine 5'-phosphate oxidase family protein [Fodinicola acaciae]|uniref:pyridoxamine 5'-phosphate oxidase family protein n=1 Tax=Fodinicola acaciae TaxID=2681555 RepID=UPI001FEB73D2|nr:pyridoxamine 5'-phosphate oxidase family protein [Fodinicola acaciae]